MMPAGAVNAWKCQQCGGLTVAVHVDRGVTPFMLACRRTEGCQGMGISSGYLRLSMPPDIAELLAWEFYKPAEKEMRELRYDIFQHVANGGLLIRELTDAGRQAVAA